MFKTKKALLAAIILGQLIWVNPAAAATFSDVKEDHSYYTAIEYLAGKGAIKGYNDGSFQAEKDVSKAEFFTILFNSKGEQTAIEDDAANFKDVPKDAWFYQTAAKALKLGLVKKNEADPNFYPHDTIAKNKALEIIFKFYNIELSSVEKGETIFTDVNSTHQWAQLAKTAKKYGIFEIDQNNYFKAFKGVNRGELASYIYHVENFGKSNLFPKTYKDLSKTNLDSSIFDNQNFNIFIDVWDRLHSDYLHKNELVDEDLIQGAIQGMLQEVGDPYTSYEPPNEAEEFNNSLNGNVEGIGVEINKIDNNVVIMSVIKGSPAEKAGILAKDVVVKVNGEDISDKTLQDLADIIRGPAGTAVKLTIKRNNQSKNFTVTRAEIDIAEVEGALIEDKIGYISISTFSYTAATDFAAEVSYLKAKGAKAFILDLRNNPGGFLNTSIDMLDQILPENKTITSVYTAKGESLTHFSEGPGTLSEMPLVVLINQGSASASEIVAAAVKEHKVGTLIGNTTFGKGTVQDISYYSDGSFFKITIAKWLTPSGDSINAIGVKPDITVNIKETDKEDMQFKKALEIIKKNL